MDMIPLDALERPIAFHRIFAKVAGSATAGLFLSQAWYWTKTLPEARDGWFYKTQKEWQEETTLTRREQETARTKLKAFGLIEEERRGIDPTLWFRLDPKALADLIVAECGAASPDGGNVHQGRTDRTAPDVGKRHQVKAESAITSLDREYVPESTAESSSTASTTTPYLLFEMLCDGLGQDAAEVPPSAKGRQLKAAKSLIEDGLTEADLPRLVSWLQAQTWLTSGIDMPLLLKMHGKWVMNGKPDSAPVNVSTFPNAQSRPGHTIVRGKDIGYSTEELFAMARGELRLPSQRGAMAR